MTYSSSLLSEILRPNARIRFLGFESSGYELQQSGWEISAQQQMSYRSAGIEIRLALYHRQANLQMLTQALTWEYRNLNKFDSETMNFEIMAVAPNIQFKVIPHSGSLSSFSSVDMTPSMASFKDVDLKEICPFLPINESVDMYLEKKAVDELLELIKQKQIPVQDAIRKRNELRAWKNNNIDSLGNYNPRQEIKAQLIAI